MKDYPKLKCLVAPLDWGLGHATRCIPLINKLLKAGHEVLIAAEGRQQVLLQQEFPQLLFLPLKGYRIKYARTKRGLLLAMFFQLPKIFAAIRYENNWLKEIHQKHCIDVVLSDNRYGMHHKDVHSVFITHQLFIQTPFHFSGAWLQKFVYRFINNFNDCWVPDRKDVPYLAGMLSHPPKLPAIPLHYTGLLSRFSFGSIHQTEHLLIMLSGPEPQRTLLEKQLLAQANDLNESVLFVRGLPGGAHLPPVGSHLSIVNHLAAKELEEAIKKASMVISRTGYSTVMDLMVLQKKSILIPTPGQTEQEYLARYLTENKFALCIHQLDFDLKRAIEMALTFPFNLPFTANTTDLDKTIERLERRAII